MAIKAEYIWLDGVQPTPDLRSKTKILAEGTEPPTWGFDGSSTEQAEGHSSDCVLKPVFTCPDPLRGGDDILVLCEVYNADGTASHTNNRAAAAETASQFADQDPWFGIEQEYTMMTLEGHPAGFPEGGFPKPQGPQLERATGLVLSASSRVARILGPRRRGLVLALGAASEGGRT